MSLSHIALASLLALAAAQNEAGTPSFGDAQLFAFDVSSGMYEEKSHRLDCAINVVEGEASFTEYRSGTRWHPGVGIFLFRGTGSTQRIVALKFSAQNYRPPFRVDFGSALDDSQDLGHLVFGTTVGPHGQFAF